MQDSEGPAAKAARSRSSSSIFSTEAIAQRLTANLTGTPRLQRRAGATENTNSTPLNNRRAGKTPSSKTASKLLVKARKTLDNKGKGKKLLQCALFREQGVASVNAKDTSAHQVNSTSAPNSGSSKGSRRSVVNTKDRPSVVNAKDRPSVVNAKAASARKVNSTSTPKSGSSKGSRP